MPKFATSNFCNANKLQKSHVNHERHYVDPSNGTTTNTVESMWNFYKRDYPGSYPNDHGVPGTFALYMLKRKCRFVGRNNFFGPILQEIARAQRLKQAGVVNSEEMQASYHALSLRR